VSIPITKDFHHGLLGRSYTRDRIPALAGVYYALLLGTAAGPGAVLWARDTAWSVKDEWTGPTIPSGCETTSTANTEQAAHAHPAVRAPRCTESGAEPTEQSEKRENTGSI
jgi:hypothetical protein